MIIPASLILRSGWLGTELVDSSSWSPFVFVFFPPGCSSDILMFLRMHVLITVSFRLSMLLDKFMPLWLLYLPFYLFPFYIRMT